MRKKLVISAGLSTLLPQINLCDPFGGEDKAYALSSPAEEIPCNETSPCSLCLMSTPDALLEVMGQRYREVYNQQAEKQMSIQYEGPPIKSVLG